MTAAEAIMTLPACSSHADTLELCNMLGVFQRTVLLFLHIVTH